MTPTGAASRSEEKLSGIVSVRHLLAPVCGCDRELFDFSEIHRCLAPFETWPSTRRHSGCAGAEPPQRSVRVVEVIARIKVLGMRAANRGTLRAAARAVASYLQGDDDEAEADTKRRSPSLAGGGAGAMSDGSNSLGGVLGYYLAGEGGR